MAATFVQRHPGDTRRERRRIPLTRRWKGGLAEVKEACGLARTRRRHSWCGTPELASNWGNNAAEYRLPGEGEGLRKVAFGLRRVIAMRAILPRTKTPSAEHWSLKGC